MLRSFIYAVAILVCFDVHAQLMPFKNYGIKDGLNDNNVQVLTTDDRGLLWVGTDVSLYWFDGKKFYQPQITTNIGQLYINGFYKDHTGDIWILTFFNGLYRYHNGRFANYLVDTLSKDAIMNSISAMAQVADNKYVVVSQGCTYIFDGRKFSIFDSSNVTLRRNTNSVAEFANNKFLLGTDEGVFLYGSENGKFILEDRALPSVAVYKVVVTSTRILILTKEGVLSFPNAGKQPFSNPCKKYLAGKAVRDIAADKEGKLWVLADTVFKIENEQITKYSQENGLPTNIQSIYCDKQGLLWFANRAGISMLGDEYYEFSSIRDDKNYIGVSSLDINSQNDLWIGTGNGIAVRKNGAYIFTREIDGQKIGSIGDIRKNSDGTAIVTTACGVVTIGADNSIKKVFNIKGTKIGEDSKKRQWFGDVDGHVWLNTGGALRLMNADNFIPEMISCLYPEGENLWVGYRGAGVRKYYVHNDSLKFLKEYSAATGYNDMRVRSCAADKSGNIIWGTRTNGIFVFSRAGDTLIAHITIQNGLNANWIKDIKCDTGKLYLATNNGINILSGDYRNPVISHLRINSETVNRETNCILKTGNVFYIGTNEGILKWMPDNMHKDTAAPPIYFTNISIQGMKNFLVNPYIADAGEITLPYDQHVVSFEFSGISLKDPVNVKYQYILEGENNEWSPFTEYNYVTYNLKPGNYTFKVAAENADGVVSRTPAVFHFIIRPPFWSTWWFIILIAVIILLAAYGAYRYKLNQALAVALLRNNISTGLHDDIGSTLSSISILSNMALNEKSDVQMMEMIKGIKENSTSLLEKMDDIVWSINPNNDALENLIVRFRRFASVLLEAKNIEYTIEVSPAIKKLKISMSYRQHIYLILKETINNLIKYSNCTRVYIGVLYENNCLDITVQDNGDGFDTETVEYGNGIMNMKQRAKYMNAVVKIDTAPGAGTKISIQVKIR